jgi:signal transduction histidine kinase
MVNGSTEDSPASRRDAGAVPLEAERAARVAAEAEAARLERLQAVTAALSVALTPDQVADVTVREGFAALGAARGAVLVAPEGGAPAVLRSAGLDEDEARVAAALAGAHPVGPALRRGEPVFAASAAEAAPLWRAPGAPPGALAALPLVARGRWLGAVIALHAAPRAWTDADRAYAVALASLCAQALDRAGLYLAERLSRAEAVAARRRLAFLDELSERLAASLDAPALAHALVELAVPAIADHAALYVSGEGGPVLVAGAGPAPLGEAAAAGLDAESGLARAAAGERVVVTVPAGGAGDPLAVVAVPLSVAGRSLGALVLASPESAGRHGPADLALAADVARRAALALEHARLLGEAHHAARVREEFLAVASHELRGPLGTLRFAVQLLLRDHRSGSARSPEARLRIVERQADRLVRLGDALLDVSRITAGRLELTREETDLAALAREASARIAAEAADAGSALVCEAPDPVVAFVDDARLEQVIQNLLSNAVKYGSGKPIRITVRVADGRAHIEVADQGIGIAPADQARIFGRFERAVSARNYAGLGLGLWIARHIVEAHGGAIRVTSAMGVGSTFDVELPLAPSVG